MIVSNDADSKESNNENNWKINIQEGAPVNLFFFSIFFSIYMIPDD